jgi:hypothetical protein
MVALAALFISVALVVSVYRITSRSIKITLDRSDTTIVDPSWIKAQMDINKTLEEVPEGDLDKFNRKVEDTDAFAELLEQVNSVFGIDTERGDSHGQE